ncbi:MAG: hypothetical protein OK436_07635 [Thaumarchaeota archaeon]|nr:hypothetical protein [Nitrososphaerota archaeon]
MPQLPKPEYLAIQSLREVLGASQLEVVLLGVRLVAAMAKDALTPPPPHRQAQLDSLRAMLLDLRQKNPPEEGTK